LFKIAGWSKLLSYSFLALALAGCKTTIRGITSSLFSDTPDTTSPTVIISAPSASYANAAASITYTLTFSDDEDLGTLSNAAIDAAITISGASTTGCTAVTSGAGASTRTVTITGCSDNAGSASISIGALAHSDEAGNALTAAGPSSAFTIDNVDPAAPTVSITTSISTDTTPTFTVAALEIGNGIELFSDACTTSVETMTASAISESVTSAAITQGTYIFYAQQTDLAGNVSLCTAVGADYLLSGTPMVSVWQTTVAAETITLPLRSGYTYHALVNWGDATPDSLITAWNDADIVHTYAATGSHTVTITGIAEAWHFNNGGDKNKLYQVTELGDLGWINLSSAFNGCINLTTFAGGITSAVTNMANMFTSAAQVVPNTSTWDTSSVTSMASMFYGATLANPDTSNWGHGISDRHFLHVLPNCECHSRYIELGYFFINICDGNVSAGCSG
jgi:hypothetical protein